MPAAPGAGFEGFGGFSDIFDAFFGGAAGGGSARRGRPQPGADLRYDLRITFEEAVKGTEKEIDFRVLGRCETCTGTGAKPGTEPTTCPQCEGRGEVRSVRQTMLGQMVNVSACPRCRGEGKIVETPVRRRARATAAPSASARLRVTIPAGIDEGHQIRLTNEGEVGAARRPGRVARTSRSTSARTRRSSATAPSCTTRPGVDRPGRARARASPCPTVDGDEEVEIKAGTQPDTEIRLRGKGVPHLRRTGSRGDLHVLVDVVVPTKLSQEAARVCSRRTRRRPARRSEGGGIREKLGL